MASRTTTDPLEILLEMGVDLDNLSAEEDYLSALMEAVNTLTIKDPTDPRIAPLQLEVRNVRKKRFSEAKKTTIKPDAFFNRNPEEVKDDVRSGAIDTKKLKFTSVNIAPKQKALPTSALVPYQSDKEEEKEQKKTTQQDTKDTNLLANIAKNVTDIADTLRQQYKQKQKAARSQRTQAEQAKRKLQESKLEKNFKGLKKVAEKVIAPVKSALQSLFDFFLNIFIGRFLVKFFDWFGDPKNQEKVTSLIRFFSDHGPKLLGLYLLFGTSIGRFLTGFAAKLVTGAARLLLGVGRFAATLAAKFPFLIPILAGAGLFALGAAIPKVAPDTVDAEEKKTKAAPGTKEEKLEKLREQKENLSFIDKLFGVDKEIDEQIEFIETGKTKQYSGGGEVSGPAGVDKVPAMLTHGEFVMSRGAVQKYGLAQLEAMNAAAGGTNKPKIMDGTVFAKGGGSIGGGPMFPENAGDILPTLKGDYDRAKDAAGAAAGEVRERVKRVRQAGIDEGYLSKRGRFEGAAKSQAFNFISDLFPTLPGISHLNKAMTESYLTKIGMGRESANQFIDPDDGKRKDFTTAFYGGSSGIDRAHSVGQLQVNKMSNDSKNYYLKKVKAGLAAGTLQSGDLINAYDLDSKDPIRREQGTVRFFVGPDGSPYLMDTYGFDPGKVDLGSAQAEYDKQVKAFQDPSGGIKTVGWWANKFKLKPLADATEGGPKVQFVRALITQKLFGYDPEKEAMSKLGMRFKTKVQVDELRKFMKPEELKQLLTLSKNQLSLNEKALLEKADKENTKDAKKTSQDVKEKEKNLKNQRALEAKRPWYDKLGLFGGASAVIQAEELKERNKLTEGMTESQKRFFTGGGGLAAMKKDGKTLEQVISSGKLALKPQLEKEKQSRMAMIMGGKNAYYSSTTNRYYKNYTEALKDPKVAAAAKVEETKKKLSFAPTPPKLTPPPPPSFQPKVNVIPAPSQSGESVPTGNGSGSEVDARPTGNGSANKFKILGVSWPF